jgi:hypothetical protein
MELSKIQIDPLSNSSCNTLIYSPSSTLLTLVYELYVVCPVIKGVVDIEDVRQLMKEATGVTLVDDIDNNQYPMPLNATAQYDVMVGRIRQSLGKTIAPFLLLPLSVVTLLL